MFGYTLMPLIFFVGRSSGSPLISALLQGQILYKYRKTDATTPNNVGTRSASWEGCNPQDFVNHVMHMRGLNKVGRAVQTDQTFVHYASAITEEKKF